MLPVARRHPGRASSEAVCREGHRKPTCRHSEEPLRSRSGQRAAAVTWDLIATRIRSTPRLAAENVESGSRRNILE